MVYMQFKFKQASVLNLVTHKKALHLLGSLKEEHMRPKLIKIINLLLHLQQKG